MIKETNTKTMRNLHHKINLREMMIESLRIEGQKKYGTDSATFKSPYFKINIALQVAYILKGI